MVYPTLWRSSAPSVWDEMFSTRRELDRVFDRFFTGQPTAGTVWTPVVDVRESEEAITVVAELPGLRPEDVDVSIENNVLSVTGEKRQEVEEGREEGGSYHVIERRYGRFERSFTLPPSVEAGNIAAHFENGVLTVTLPKTEAAKPRRVQVYAGNGPAQVEAQRKSAK